MALAACHRERPSSGPLRVVLKHQPLSDDAAPLASLLRSFERLHPDVRIEPQLLPSASETLHQYLLTTLEGGSADFDVFVADVIWIAELARAGWIVDLSQRLPPSVVRREFVSAAAEAGIFEERTFAIPWYVDVGLLHRRIDLVPDAPRTFDELVDGARRNPSMRGWVLQARQYEGLVCCAFEILWGFGARTKEGERVVLDTKEAREALGWLRARIVEGVVPRSVLSMAEEESRRVFQSGNAVFMRNWPYAYAEAERPDSPIRGRVAVSTLPTADGSPGFGALGGWHLAINANVPSERREAAERLVEHLTSLDANALLATAYARNPARRSAYDDPRVLRDAPHIARLLPMIERARPRPITPWYPMISDVLQSELSAIVAGVRSPENALGRAQMLIDRIVRPPRGEG